MKLNKLLLLSLIILFTGCSNYTVGRLLHPQIKTIGIGKIKNSTDQPKLSFYMIEKLEERFMQDASLKVVPVEEADIIITGKITRYDVDARGVTHQDEREEGEGFFSTIFRTNITFKYEVKTRKNWNVIAGTVTEGADFTELIDQLEEQRNAFRRAAYEVSKTVVSEITEAW